MNVQLRVARPVTDLAASAEQYKAGLGLTVVASFVDHDGFDGVVLALPGADWHLELTLSRVHAIEPSASVEDLLVFYVEERASWEARCHAMREAGFDEVAPNNPYWARLGRTYADRDGYRVVIQRAAWKPSPME